MKNPELRNLMDEELEALLIATNEELTRRIDLGREWCTLAEAAKRIGISKGSVHHAITKGELRSRRLLPPPGRASLVLLVHLDDVDRYVPRNYPRRERERINRRDP